MLSDAVGPFPNTQARAVLNVSEYCRQASVAEVEERRLIIFLATMRCTTSCR